MIEDVNPTLLWLSETPREVPIEGTVNLSGHSWPWSVFTRLADDGLIRLHRHRDGYALALLTQTGLEELNGQT